MTKFHLATVLLGFSLSLLTSCASPSKNYEAMTFEQLHGELKSIMVKLEKNEIPRWEDTSSAACNLMCKPTVYKATEGAPRAIKALQEVWNSNEIQLIDKSINAECERQGKKPADLKPEERKAMQEKIISSLTPEQRASLAALQQANRQTLEQEKANQSELAKTLAQIAVDVGMKVVEFGKQSTNIMAGIGAARELAAWKSGLSQVNSVIDYVKPTDEVIIRCAQILDMNDELARNGR